jgi:6-O-methylguanine DNA methyltransferase, DNA binding domain
MRSRKSWREKLEHAMEPKLVAMPPRMQARYGRGKLLIPRALDVDALIRTVPKGRLITQSKIREILADRAGANVTCPIPTGIFVWLSAEAAAEEERAGKKRVTPYWRVVRDDGSLMAKMPGGAEEQARRLAAEGHILDRKGKKLIVRKAAPRP